MSKFTFTRNKSIPKKNTIHIISYQISYQYHSPWLKEFMLLLFKISQNLSLHTSDKISIYFRNCLSSEHKPARNNQNNNLLKFANSFFNTEIIFLHTNNQIITLWNHSKQIHSANRRLLTSVTNKLKSFIYINTTVSFYLQKRSNLYCVFNLSSIRR